MNDLKSKSITAFIWDFVGKILTQGMSFIFSIFLARLLSPSEFGLIAMIMVIIGIASVFTDIGLGGALIQRSRLLSVHFSSVFYFNLAIGLLLSIICYVSAGWVAVFYDSPELEPLTQVMALSFVISAFGSVQATKLRKDLNYAALTRASFIASLLSGGVGVALAFQGAGVWSLVAQNLLMGLVFNMAVWRFSAWRPTVAFSFKALKQLWGFGFRMFLSGLLDAVFTRLDYLVIGKLFLPATLGFFQRAKSLEIMVTRYSSGSLMAVLFPVLSQLKNNLPRFRQIIVKAMRVICFVVFLLVGGLYVTAEELIVLLFGDKWLPSVDFFKLLVLSGFGYPVSCLLVNVLSSRGNSKAFLRLEIYKKIITSINLCVLYGWGINHYLYGLLVCSVLSVALNMRFSTREIQLSLMTLLVPLIDQALICLLSVVLVLYGVSFFPFASIELFLVKGGGFVGLYGLFNYVFKPSAYRAFVAQIQPIIQVKILGKKERR